MENLQKLELLASIVQTVEEYIKLLTPSEQITMLNDVADTLVDLADEIGESD